MSSFPRRSPASPAGLVVKPQNIVVTDSEESNITQSGTWTSVEEAMATDLTYIYSDTTSDYLKFSFKGSALWMRYFGDVDTGEASISIDDGTAVVLDTYSSIFRPRMCFAASNLSPETEHTVKITVKGTKNSNSLGYKINIDAFIVEVVRGASQVWAMIEESFPAGISESKAESKVKSSVSGDVSTSGAICTITPADGKKVVLLMIVGSSDTSGNTIKLQTLQSSTWTDVIPQIYLMTYGGFALPFPCWSPTQDTGDGSTVTIRLFGGGTGNWTGFILYYEE